MAVGGALAGEELGADARALAGRDAHALVDVAAVFPGFVPPSATAGGRAERDELAAAHGEHGPDCGDRARPQRGRLRPR